MRFDPTSFLLGFGSASGLSFALWRYRARLASFREAAESQVEGTRRFIGRTADARYSRDMLSHLQQYHIAGDLCNLTDVLLEPQVIPLPMQLVLPGSEDAPPRDVFDVIPLVHDMPQSYAPYNVETLTLEQLSAGERCVAILGVSGMGKSTALATLGLMALGEVEFESIEDITEQAISEEERDLSPEERSRRVQERRQIQERAFERLHDAHQQQRERLGQTDETEKPPALEIANLVPVLIHMNDLDFDMSAYGRGSTLDPAEPLVRAAQRRVTLVTSQVVGSVVYPALEHGRALILVDGYDELSPAARETYFYWLQQLIDMYGHNMIVIAGPVEGYEPLTTLGFTPVFLRTWREEDYTTLAKRWSAVWTARGKGRRKATLPDDQTMRLLRIDNRGRSILDVTLKIWTGLADDARQTGRMGWYDAYVNRRLSASERRDLLPPLAVRLLEARRPVERALLDETLAQAFPQPEESQKGPKVEGILDGLVKDGLLLHYPDDTFAFSHSQIMSYLASQTVVQAGPERAAEVALEPVWQDALTFAAAKVNLQAAIYRKLGSPPDLLYSELFGLVRWLPDAPPDAPWRGDLFKRLAAALMAPEQYPAVRARAMAALIASRDKNVLFILRQALRAAAADVRKLACVGLGALGDPEAIRDLAPMLGDDDRDVQLAAGLALGAIGTDKALEIMVHGLLEGSDELRRAVAETLAAIPGEGHAVLRDGVESDDIMIRRATVYGLSRVRAPWALIALYRTMMEDEQWYVRTAAEEAFMQAQSPEREGLRSHPEADTLIWLVQWAADRGEGVPAGENARQVLVRALQEGHPVHKMMAAQTLARLGHVPALKPLYGALRDRDETVRGAAYAALVDLQMRLGQPLPGLV